MSFSHRAVLLLLLLPCVAVFVGTFPLLTHAGEPIERFRTLDGTFEGAICIDVSSSSNANMTLSTAGDVNGDGYDDILIGFPADKSVHLVYGQNASAWGSTIVRQIFTFPEGAEFGAAIAGGGDADNDGFDDFMIGDPKAYDGKGFAVLVYGRNGTEQGSHNILAAPFATAVFNGTNEGGNLGSSLAFVHANTTTYSDILLGAPGVTSGAGAAYLLYGREERPPFVVPVPDEQTVSFLGSAGELSGRSVVAVGDVNGDNREDWLIGSPGASPGGRNHAGTAYLIFGSVGWAVDEVYSLSGNADNMSALAGRESGSRLGSRMAGIGFGNNDTLNDFMLASFPQGGNSSVFVASGRTAWPARTDVSETNFTDYTELISTDFTLGNSIVGRPRRESIDVVSFPYALVSATNSSGRGFVFTVCVNETYHERSSTVADITSAVNRCPVGAFQGDTSSELGTHMAYIGDVDGDGLGDVAISALGKAVVFIVFGRAFAGETLSPTEAATNSPTTGAPTTAMPTTGAPSLSPTTPPSQAPSSSTCQSDQNLVLDGATCVNGVLTVSNNVTTPGNPTAPATTTVSSSIEVVGGASFTQPMGSTLVFVATTTGSTNVVVSGTGCANIAGNAVVDFTAAPSTDGDSATVTLVSSMCIQGQFESVEAMTNFESDSCVVVAQQGEQQVSSSSLSVTFPVSQGCDDDGVNKWVLIGAIGGGALVMSVLVVIAVVLAKRYRMRRAIEDTKRPVGMTRK